MTDMIPIYRSDGEWVAVFDKGHVFNVEGEWLGFVVGRELFDPQGRYLGFLSDDQRLLCKRAGTSTLARYKPLERPPVPTIPAHAPLAPLLRELPYQIVDLFEEFPERFSYISETRADME